MKVALNDYEALMSVAATKLANAQDELTRLRKVNGELVWVLQRLLQELPAHRDWLAPELERLARDILKNSKEAI